MPPAGVALLRACGMSPWAYRRLGHIAALGMSPQCRPPSALPVLHLASAAARSPVNCVRTCAGRGAVCLVCAALRLCMALDSSESERVSRLG